MGGNISKTMYLDKDEKNWQYENLTLVNKKELGTTLSIGLSGDPVLNRTIVDVAKIKVKIKELEN